MNSIQKALQQGQAIWLDYIRRSLIKSGELQNFIQQGISGIIFNLTIFEKAIVGSTDYDKAILDLAKAGKDTVSIYEALVTEDIRTTADILRPIYDQSSGLNGYVSLEISPVLANDTNGTITAASRLFAALNRPNVMIKIPATPEGIPAIRQLISDGINVNVTLIFSLEMYRQVIEAYITGISDRGNQGKNTDNVTSVASFSLSQIDTAVDTLLEERIRQGQEQLRSLLGKAAFINAMLAYHNFRKAFDSERFTILRTSGAHMQRLLWASTGTRNPAYSDVMYIDPLIGTDTVNTMSPATIAAFLEYGQAITSLDLDISVAEQTIANLTNAGINMKSLTDKLLTEGLQAFATSFDKIMTGIEDKKVKLLATKYVYPGVDFGTFISNVENAMVDLDKNNIVRRIWQKDYTIWKLTPTEIINRLGWLRVTDLMSEQIPNLQAFAQEIINDGFHHVVLLGMGGSSLGPEVLRQVFNNATGYPELIVLDSTVPSWIQSITESIDPSRTLFLVSSKSGTTTEPLVFFHYFQELVESSVGKENAGQHFVAITDPETPLTKLAAVNNFRRTFLNHPDIGGRYSILSYFGLVPAALLGIDIMKLIERSDVMREACASCVPVHNNPGVWLGTYLGALTARGRDKLTLITSPSINSFGLWVEQLIAESTGKDGKGIIPVTGEPLMKAINYGNDRLFVYQRLKGDNNSETDRAIECIKSAGHPVLVIEMQDKYDLGAEFYRWEFAVSIAGAILNINPFNQPDVQQSKEATEQILREYTTSGNLPASQQSEETLAQLLNKAKIPSYLAIMAYIQQNQGTDNAFAKLQQKITERYGIATTIGYGPRFLHSTGQLHKGGPNTGLFLQIITVHERDIPIPDMPYTFGTVADAQALGDFQTLQSLGRNIIRIQLTKDNENNILKLVNELK
ncbi:MAG: bifunctional transaldolase/phosoglucose isomerase [Dehalococcoidales bacterium]|nr:bifunctional transaldolase/phosoglucose isomerase [Dehalococcoidales bacterium]